jgi:hypothetical protein
LLYEGWAQETYTPFEEEQLRAFQQFLEKQGEGPLDQCWDRPWRLRWLHSTGYDFEKTVVEMREFEGYQRRVRELSLSAKIAENLVLPLLLSAQACSTWWGGTATTDRSW